jgi:hypothetical protein
MRNGTTALRCLTSQSKLIPDRITATSSTLATNQAK